MGREGVQILHGPNELGKDIIFYSQGGFCERRLYACVIKNAKITGRMDTDSSARTVFHQAEAAFDTPFVNQKGQEERIESVYIVSPHECSPAAIAAIREQLKHRSGQVAFLCGATLFDMFVHHWPDFVLFDSGALTRYLATLSKTFATDHSFETLVRRYALLADTVKPLSQIYVERDFMEVLLNFSLAPAPLPAALKLRPVDLTEIDAIAMMLHNSEQFCQATSRDGQNADLVRSHQVLVAGIHDSWRRALAANREQLAFRRRNHEKALRERHDKTGDPSPFRPPSEADYATEGLQEQPEHELSLALDGDGVLRQQYHQLLERVRSRHTDLKATVARANRYAANPNDDHDGQCRSAYNTITSIAKHAGSFFRAEASQTFLPARVHRMDFGDRAVLITGPAGFGKTSLCKWQALQDAKAYLDGESRVLPFYSQLHLVHPRDGEAFQETLIPREDLRDLFRESDKSGRRIRLYLDGLDEVPDTARQQAIMGIARQAIDERADVDIVATAREHVTGAWQTWIRRFRIADLSDRQVSELVSRWLEESPKDIREFYRQLDRLPALRQLMRTPLLGTLVIAVFRRTGAIPQSRIQLYELFVELHCGGWDLAKNIRRNSMFGSHDKELVLMEFASRLHYNERRDGQTREFRRCATEIFPSLSDKWSTMLDEVLEDGLLTRAGTDLMFSHLSFQEYLTARRMVEPEGVRASAILRKFLRGDEWWKEVLVFFVGMQSGPQEMAKWLDKHATAVRESGGSPPNVQARYEHLAAALRSVYPFA